MLYVGFVQRSMRVLIPTTSTVMNSRAKSTILTEIVNVKLLVWGMEVLQRAGGQHHANS